MHTGIVIFRELYEKIRIKYLDRPALFNNKRTTVLLSRARGGRA